MRPPISGSIAAPALALHLVLARLDDEAKDIVSVGKAAQLGKADRLVSARPDDEIVAWRKIEPPAGDLRRRNRRQRIERPEPVGAGAARDATARAIRHINIVRRQRPARLARAADRFGHVGFAWCLRERDSDTVQVYETRSLVPAKVGTQRKIPGFPLTRE
jgi:hypothetical protein